MSEVNELTKKETAKAAEAYADYAALGSSRSLAKLAEKYGKSTAKVRQFERWSTDFGWQERVKVYDSEQRERKEQKRLADIETMNIRQSEQAQEMQKVAIDHICTLIDAEAFGSLATVHLLKNSIEAERKALHADEDVTKLQITGKDDGPIIITTTWGGGALEDEE